MKKLSFCTRASSLILLALLLLGATTISTAQIPGSHPMTDIYGHMGIGTIAPDKSAILDLSTTTAGFLMPRMTTAERNAIANPATGLMIFNTNSKTIEFNIGTAFAPIWDTVLTVSTGSGIFWSLTGNGGTNPAINFIGTTDGQPLVVRTNSVERLRVAVTGEVGIGTAAPTAGRLLEVAGAAGAANVRFGSASGAADGSVWVPGATDGVITADGNGDLLKRTATAVVGSVAWLRTGNAGTTAGTNFVGTTDNMAFEIHVDNGGTATEGRRRVMRYEPNATSPNIIGGFNGNSVTAGVVGATLAGGGANGSLNTITDNYGVVGGGNGNRAGDNGGTTSDSRYATVSGGGNNTASGLVSTVGGGASNTASGGASTVGGGVSNTASNSYSLVGGGGFNMASGVYSTVGGGYSDTALGTSSTVGGGYINMASGDISTVSGGQNNTASGGISTVGGGQNNTASGDYSAVGGGQNNTASGDSSTVGGGYGNHASGLASTVGGGLSDTASEFASTVAGGYLNKASANTSTVGGGRNNTASEFASTVAGGRQNVASEEYATVGGGWQDTALGLASTIGGGYLNTASRDYSTVGGGQHNMASGFTSTVGGGSSDTASGDYSTVGGGFTNTASRQYSTVGGGNSNTASGAVSTVSGGFTNTASGGAATVGGGSSNTAVQNYSTVGGGYTNAASQNYSTVGGGSGNTASGGASTVGGGSGNTAAGHSSVIPGGTGLTLDADADGSFGFLGGNTGGHNMTISADNVAVFGNTNLWLANNNNAPSELRFFEAYNASGNFPNTANYTAFRAQDQTSDITYILPASPAASNGDILTSTTGGVMQWSDADSIVTANAWGLTGNAGTTAGTNFVGTTDNVAFEIRVNNTGAATGGNQRVMRFEPNATSPNIIGGFNGNSVTVGVVGATLAGGGANGNLNRVTDDYGVVGGGRNNHAGDNSGTTSDHNYATVSGGLNNTASGAGATVGGGSSNTASGIGSTVGGGQFNTVSNSSATVGGGRDNMASRDGSTVGGGVRDTASGDNATVGGGFTNTASGDASTVGGGASNTASAAASTVGGGRINTASGLHSMVGGGSNNTALGSYSTVGGGVSDTASGLYSTVSGGLTNTASGDASTVGGGYSNTAAGHYSAIPGGTGLTLDADADGSFGFLGGNTGSNNMTISTPDVAVFGNANLWLANNNNAPSELRFFEAYNTAGAFPNTANYTAFKAQDQTSDITYTLPASPAASNGDILTSTTGGVMQWSDADSIVTANAWSLLGNAGTTAGTNFVGTTDNVAFEIRVNNTGAATGGNQRVMRFEPNATSPNIIGGFNGNSVTAGVVGATISGGGINGGTNVISSNYSTIGGGRSNAIGASSSNSTIAGGVSNQVGASAGNGTVSGGLGNVIVSGDHTTIGGGFNNRINTGAFGSTLGGGTNNIASSHTSVIDGGNANSIGTSSQFSTIGGGHQNTINNSAFESVIAGGTTDTIETGATYSTIGGGTSNAIRSSSTRSVIAGGYNNEVSADRSTISGGELNVISGARSAIPGGRGLTLSGAGSFGFLGGNGGSNDMTISAANVAVFGNTDLWLANNDNAPSELRFFEAETGTGAFPSGTNYTAFKAQDQTADITYTLPAAAPAGAGNGVLTANAAGTMSWGSHRRVAAVAGTAQVIADPAITATSTVIVTIEGTVASGTITARTAGTNFTVTTNVALATTDFINYIILP